MRRRSHKTAQLTEQHRSRLSTFHVEDDEENDCDDLNDDDGDNGDDGDYITVAALTRA